MLLRALIFKIQLAGNFTALLGICCVWPSSEWKKCFLVASCCCSLSVSVNSAFSLPMSGKSWRRLQNQESWFMRSVEMWCHTDAVHLLVWKKNKPQCGSQRFYLGNVSQPIVDVQTPRAWLLDLVEFWSVEEELLTKWCTWKQPAFLTCLQWCKSMKRDTSHCWVVNILEFFSG